MIVYIYYMGEFVGKTDGAKVTGPKSKQLKDLVNYYVRLGSPNVPQMLMARLKGRWAAFDQPQHSEPSHNS